MPPFAAISAENAVEASLGGSVEVVVDAAAPDVDVELQELVTTYCWGWNWGREGLPLRDRSLINIAMIAILNRSHELKIHIRGALNNGLSRDEIREVLLQVGIYGGIPAAVDSFRLANEAFAEIDAENAAEDPGFAENGE